jgi:hypothetical protein
LLLGLSLAALFRGLGTRTVLTPSASGLDDGVSLPVSAGAGESSERGAAEAPAALVPRVGPGWRVLAGFVGVAMLFAAGVLALGGGWMDLVMAVVAACLGGTMGYVAVTGHDPISPREYTLSRRFAELTDPARPLSLEDSRLPALEPAGEDTARDAVAPDSSQRT